MAGPLQRGTDVDAERRRAMLGAADAGADRRAGTSHGPYDGGRGEARAAGDS